MMARQNGWRWRSRELFFVFCLTGAFVLFALPALTQAACQNARAERVLRFLLRDTNADSESANEICGAAPSAVELRALEQLAAGESAQAKADVADFLSTHPTAERSDFWAARLTFLAAKLPVTAGQIAYDLAAQIAPTTALFWYQRGDFFAENGMPDKALESYRGGIQAQPEKAVDGYARLGALYYQLRRMDEALEAFQQVERMERARPILPNWRAQLVYFYIAEIYRSRQNWGDSIVYYQRALDAAQTSGWPTYAAFVGLGDVAAAQGDRAQAYALYTRALDFAATAAQRQVVQSRLAK